MIERATLAGEQGARWAFRLAIVAALVVFAFLGHRQWFVRDDWGFLLSRNALHRARGWQAWLFEAQDGHWMTPPILMFRAVHLLFGIDSYWPFLVMVLAMHVGIVVLVHELCRRVGVAPWTAALLCGALLVFGNGWENIVFAIQITFNLSLLAFLAQLLLVDHDGPIDRRDVAGAAIGVVGVMSSGFGPFFVLGVGVLLGLRRRWRALAVAVVPQGLAYGWWYVTWQSDPAADRTGGRLVDVPRFVLRGLTSTFHSLTILPGLGVVALVASLAAVATKPAWSRSQTMLVALWVTVLAMLAGVGIHRVGFGIAFAASSRYQYVVAMLCVPALACAIDLLRRARRVPVVYAGLAVVVLTGVSNANSLRINADRWADASQDQKDIFELIAGSPWFARADPLIVPYLLSPDVDVATLHELVDEDAITPHPPADAAELARVAAILGEPAPTG